MRSKRSLSAIKRVAKKLEFGAAVSPAVPKAEFELERAGDQKPKRNIKGKKDPRRA